MIRLEHGKGKCPHTVIPNGLVFSRESPCGTATASMVDCSCDRQGRCHPPSFVSCKAFEFADAAQPREPRNSLAHRRVTEVGVADSLLRPGAARLQGWLDLGLPEGRASLSCPKPDLDLPPRRSALRHPSPRCCTISSAATIFTSILCITVWTVRTPSRHPLLVALPPAEPPVSATLCHPCSGLQAA